MMVARRLAATSPPSCPETGCVPNVHAGLHQPGRTCVPQCVRTYPFETGPSAGRGESLFHVLEAHAVLVNDEADLGPALACPSQMR